MLEQTTRYCGSCGSMTLHSVHRTDLHGKNDWTQCMKCGYRTTGPQAVWI